MFRSAREVWRLFYLVTGSSILDRFMILVYLWFYIYVGGLKIDNGDDDKLRLLVKTGREQEREPAPAPGAGTGMSGKCK